MSEVRMLVDKEFMEALQKKVGGAKATEACREALTLFNWAVDEVRSGRSVVSCANNGGDVKRLVTPMLTAAENQAKKDKKKGGGK